MKSKIALPARLYLSPTKAGRKGEYIFLQPARLNGAEYSACAIRQGDKPRKDGTRPCYRIYWDDITRLETPNYIDDAGAVLMVA